MDERVEEKCGENNIKQGNAAACPSQQDHEYKTCVQIHYRMENGRLALSCKTRKKAAPHLVVVGNLHFEKHSAISIFRHQSSLFWDYRERVVP